MKRKILLSAITLGIIGLIVYINISERIVYNKADAIGNTAGNLLNGGLFCEYDNHIYFSNSQNNEILYSMNSNCTNFKKLTNCSVNQINVAGKYIFYSIVDSKSNDKNNNSTNIFGYTKKGLYRINRNGANAYSLCENSTDSVALYGNDIFYQHYDEKQNSSLYKVKIDQKTGTKVSNSYINPSGMDNGVFYYSNINTDHNLYKFDISSNQNQLIMKGNLNFVIPAGDYLYYMDIDNNYTISRCKKDGSKPEIIVTERTCTFNISNDFKYLYYQVDDGIQNGICRMNLKTRQETLILKGNFHNIHVTSNYIFFREFDTDITYIVPINKPKEAKIFNLPSK